jgi:hypothetical protein
MASTTWVDYVTAVGAIATPIIVLMLAAVGWAVRTQMERRYSLEDKLREDRIGTYNQILEPFTILLMTDEAWRADPANKNRDKNTIAMQKMLSLSYRSQGFKLSLVGPDSVVRSYNNLMQYFYQRSDDQQLASEEDVKEMMGLLGQFLLEIRRSMGNESTALDNWEMLEWFLTDARKYRPVAKPSTG